MKLFSLVACLLIFSSAHAINVNPACPVTVGTLTLSVTSPRTSGISPLLIFFDATTTTDSATLAGANNPFQDVTYTWSFGDTLGSGTSTWAYGSNPNVNSRNSATGPVAAHLYETQGRDTKYTVTVTATDGTNTAVCSVGVTAFDPNGANAYATTVCQSSSGTPVAGSGGCPAGASVSHSASEATNLSAAMSSKRVLFKCGDTFSIGANIGGTKFQIGAYGGCQDTQVGRPIMHGSLTGGTGTITDGRVTDLDFESTGSYAVSIGFPSGANINGPMTLNNLMSNGNGTSYYWSQGQQYGLINSVQTGGSGIGTFVNYGENNCVNGSTALNCGGKPNFVPINYQAILGNSIDGTGAGPGNVEALRVSACRMCVIAYNNLKNAGGAGATLKFHSGNTFNTLDGWIGQYAELTEISDNAFTGQSAAAIAELCAQNGQVDERLRNIIFERNLLAPSTGAGRSLVDCAVNSTVRDNVVNGTLLNLTWGFQIASRGVMSQGLKTPRPTGVEVYNNTCRGASAGQTCVGFSNANNGTAGANSFAKNNLMFDPVGGTAVFDGGIGNTISNNTTTVTANPNFTNGSGTFSVISDFKPTANFTGGVRVPVHFDALGVAWSPIWDLGAVHH